jgi:hypothetical protein
MPLFHDGPNVLNGVDLLAGATVRNLDAAGVDAGPVAARSDGFRPAEQVIDLFFQQAATFFLVEKKDGMAGKALGFC